MKSSKMFSHSSADFTETVKHKVLHCANVDGNNNKFYSIEIQKNPSTGEYRIFTHYGRLGISDVYEMRGPVDSGSLYVAEKEFESIVKKKLRGKTVKDDSGNARTEKYVEVSVVSSNVGSTNVRKNGDGVSKKISASNGTAKKAFGSIIDVMNFEPTVKTLLHQLLAENVHNITSRTSITVTSSGMETPLGPVTSEHVDKARNVLMDLKGVVSRGASDSFVRNLNTHYFSLIPHPFGRKITDNDMILTDVKLADEFDMLDQLDAAIQVSNVTTDDSSSNHFGVNIELLNPTSREFTQLADRVEKTRRHSQLKTWKVDKIYSICNEKERDRFINGGYARLKNDGPCFDLFHGSKNSNIFSLLLNGFMIPPVNAGYVTGRMFGNGVYGASSSTKSLNYSTGYWGGVSNKYPNSFLFITKFAMGKMFETESTHTDGPPRGKGYNSLYAKAGRSLQHDEFIVYNTDQTTLRYLIEFKK